MVTDQILQKVQDLMSTKCLAMMNCDTKCFIEGRCTGDCKSFLRLVKEVENAVLPKAQSLRNIASGKLYRVRTSNPSGFECLDEIGIATFIPYSELYKYHVIS